MGCKSREMQSSHNHSQLRVPIGVIQGLPSIDASAMNIGRSSRTRICSPHTGYFGCFKVYLCCFGFGLPIIRVVVEMSPKTFPSGGVNTVHSVVQCCFFYPTNNARDTVDQVTYMYSVPPQAACPRNLILLRPAVTPSEVSRIETGALATDQSGARSFIRLKLLTVKLARSIQNAVRFGSKVLLSQGPEAKVGIVP
jgi:hypothetical protein